MRWSVDTCSEEADSHSATTYRIRGTPPPWIQEIRKGGPGRVARLARGTLFTLHKALVLRLPKRFRSTAAARADPEDIALDGPGQ